MWQSYALIGVLFNCLENIIDKRAFCRCETIDNDVSAFIRVFLYCAWMVIIMVAIGIPISFYYDPGIVIFGLFSVGLSLAYTFVLKRVHASTISILSYTAPLFFLIIDKLLGNAFTFTQVLAIFGLVLGGIGFTLDERLKFDRLTIAAFIFIFAYSGIEFYYARWLVEETKIPMSNLFLNIWAWCTVFLLVIVAVKGKLKKLLEPEAYLYGKYSVVAKVFDASNTVAWTTGFYVDYSSAV